MSSNNKYKQFGVGWLKTTKANKQYISARANGKTQKIKLLAQMEDGSTVAVDSFAVFFNEEKANENAPDVQFVFTPEN